MKHRHLPRALVTGALALGMMAVAPLVGAALDPGGTFLDDNDSIHEASIEAIAAEGITRGCNPPVNDLFCPTATVTREQMASFLVRALDLPAGAASFTDIDESIHKADIAALATAGVTRGCNPPISDLFCPTATVTREQMASFLVRGLDLPAGTASFTDVSGSPHLDDIMALATAGITKGCNPPINDRFCPQDPVTREQMASFSTRALGLVPIEPPPPLPAVSPSSLVVYGASNWLYFDETINQTCLADSVFTRTIAELDKARMVVEASGRQFVYAIAPNKGTIHSDTVPGTVWDGSCADTNSDRLRAALTAAADPNRVELWDPFAAAASVQQLYFKHDTHWNSDGAVLGSELIATQAAPGVWANIDVLAAPASRQGDLADIIGVEWVVDYNELTPTLPGVAPVVTVEGVTIAGRPLVSYSSPASPTLSEVPTAVIHDSFGLFFRNKLGPLFESVSFLPTFSHPIPDAARPFLVGSEQIVIEIVERNLIRDFIGTGTAGHLLAALADDFAQTQVVFSRVGEEMDFTLPAGSPGDLRYLVIVTDSSSAVIGSSADIDISDLQGAWPNEITADASRYGFEVVGTPGTLRLPLPSSVDVTSAFVVVVE
ncbi:MAG: S-layer homology domain-containing protein [Actinomycetota bacterium]|nr:S-layer homology domain-containing protein [Actinomycetota bacterium]